jgi:hypothetical protein
MIAVGRSQIELAKVAIHVDETFFLTQLNPVVEKTIKLASYWPK